MMDSRFVIAAVLVAIAAVLVASETAVARVTRVRAEELSRDGRRGAAALIRVVADRSRYVNVLLFLHLVASTLAVVLVFDAVDELMSPAAAIVVAVAVMVIVNFVALGVAPRTLGRQHPDRIALRAAPIARLLAALLGPLTRLLILVGNAITPGRGYREGPFASAAELRELVDLAEADEVIEEDERQMIHSVFELGDTVAREVMVPRTEMVFVERNKTLRQALSLCLRSGFSRIPVIGEGNDDVIGVAYLRDITRRMFEHRDSEHSERIDSLMRPAYLVPDSKRCDVLLREMQADRVHMAILVDEYGGTAGLVTIEDVLEEIVGDITDEYDIAAPEVEALSDGVYRVSSRMHVEDFADLIGIKIDAEEEGVDTLGGLLALRLGVVPIPGSSIEIEGWTLTAEQALGRRHRVGTVVAMPPSEPRVDDDDLDDADVELPEEL
jgi:CBS domain containing-hemolysin-like protein